MRIAKISFYARLEQTGKKVLVKKIGGVYKQVEHASMYMYRYKNAEGNRVWWNLGTDFEKARDFFQADLNRQEALRQRGEVFIPESTTPTPPSPDPTPTPGRHRIKNVIDSYIEQISQPDKNGERRPEKSIKAVRSILERFQAWTGKTYIDELSRTTLETWRNELNGKYEQDTVFNKLMTVTTFLKNNKLVPTPPLLPVSEFPDQKNTIPDPYTEEEFTAMMRVASYDDGLLLYFFAVTGMRDQEVAHAKREDINWELGELHVVKKLELGFAGKTRAAIRTVPLPDDLLAELRLKEDGLLFPAPQGGVERNYLRIIKEVARAAGVKATTEKPYMKAAGMVKDDWCHRFRDTCITNSLYQTSAADLLLLCARIGHGDTKTLKKYFGRLKKPYTPKLRLKRGRIAIVRAAGD